MKLSIITINYNNKEGLLKTIESVYHQSVNNFEFIIVDGGSNDGSVSVINENQSVVSNWISEKDNGIYHAMNKGTQMATGEYVIFLNSGDCFVDENVIKDVLANGIKVDILEGHTRCERKGKFSHIWYAPNYVTASTFYDGSICHQSAFIRRSLLLANPYNEKYRICSDWLFFLESLIINNYTYDKLDRLVSTFDVEGLSNSIDKKWVDIKQKERRSILENTFPLKFLEDYDNYIGNRSYFEIKIYKSRQLDYSFVKMISTILYFGDKLLSKIKNILKI